MIPSPSQSPARGMSPGAPPREDEIGKGARGAVVPHVERARARSIEPDRREAIAVPVAGDREVTRRTKHEPDVARRAANSAQVERVGTRAENPDFRNAIAVPVACSSSLFTVSTNSVLGRLSPVVAPDSVRIGAVSPLAVRL